MDEYQKTMIRTIIGLAEMFVSNVEAQQTSIELLHDRLDVLQDITKMAIEGGGDQQEAAEALKRLERLERHGFSQLVEKLHESNGFRRDQLAALMNEIRAGIDLPERPEPPPFNRD